MLASTSMNDPDNKGITAIKKWRILFAKETRTSPFVNLLTKFGNKHAIIAAENAVANATPPIPRNLISSTDKKMFTSASNQASQSILRARFKLKTTVANVFTYANT